MNKHIKCLLLILVCCVLTSIATRWFVLVELELGADCDGATSFYRHKDAFIDFVKNP